MTQTAQAPRQPRTPEEWTDFIRGMSESAFLVGPIQEIREIPDGFDITVTRVLIDVEGETYWVGKNRDDEEERGLGKSAIERLAAAAGASVKITRTDDRSHPRRCEYGAMAVMRLLDGSPHYAEASRAYDMTEDGTDWISTFDAAASKAYDKAIKARRTEEQAAEEARDAGRSAAMAALGAMHRNAETKARLRALRTCLGLRSKYRTIDLKKKHFMVLRLSATGRSRDPALAREMKLMMFAQATGATHALFGPRAVEAAPRALAYTPEERTAHALPGPSGDDQGADDVIDETTGEVRTPETGAPVTPPAETAPAAAKPPAEDIIPKGRNLPGEGKTFAQATPDELAAYVKAAEQILAAGKDAKGAPMPEPHMKAAVAKMQRAIDELDRRRGDAQTPGVEDAPW
jgi:hypothetical protein